MPYEESAEKYAIYQAARKVSQRAFNAMEDARRGASKTVIRRLESKHRETCRAVETASHEWHKSRVWISAPLPDISDHVDIEPKRKTWDLEESKMYDSYGRMPTGIHGWPGR